MPPDDLDSAMARVFKALADPTRRRLLDRIHADNGQTLGALCRDLNITRQGITQHLDLLQAAGLLSTVWRGREKLHYLNPVPLHDIYDRWIAKFEQPDLAALSSLKHQLEQETRSMVDKPKLVYVTYIAATPEQIFAALTDPQMTGQYWGHRNVSTWKTGDTWEHRRLENDTADVVGYILEVDRPRRLVHSWARPADADQPHTHSRVTYDLEPVGDVTRLTLTHEDLAPGDLDDANTGWAKVLSSLKSFLETGRPLGALVR